MKKTININVSGQLFHVDDDAFDLLSQYLTSLEKSLMNQEGGREIYQDLEARIAEIFREILSDRDQIVTLSMVQSVIAQVEEHLKNFLATRWKVPRFKQRKVPLPFLAACFATEKIK
jgi:hypothetical protein